MTYVNPNPPDGTLSTAARWSAEHSSRREPWDSVLWKRLTFTFTIAMIFTGLAASVVVQWWEGRKR